MSHKQHSPIACSRPPIAEDSITWPADHGNCTWKVSRRRFLRTALGAVSAGMAASGITTYAADPAQSSATGDQILPLSKAARDALTPDEVIARVKAGNERFRAGKRLHRDVVVELQKTSIGQWPAAVVLGCVDSRAPAEIIFDLGLGDIFNCRVAGNVESEDIIGSMEFATKLAGAKTIFVLGHSACGAVKGAIAGAELGHLTQLLAKIRPAIAETNYTGERKPDNPAFVDAVARKSVEMTIARIRKDSPVIVDLEKSGAIDIVGGFYDLATGKVEFWT